MSGLLWRGNRGRSGVSPRGPIVTRPVRGPSIADREEVSPAPLDNHGIWRRQGVLGRRIPLRPSGRARLTSESGKQDQARLITRYRWRTRGRTTADSRSQENLSGCPLWTSLRASRNIPLSEARPETVPERPSEENSTVGSAGPIAVVAHMATDGCRVL
jgi:hypothetical protein